MKSTIVFFTNNKPEGGGGKETDSITVMRLSTPYDLRAISKIFQGGAQGELIDSMRNELNNIKYFKPKASRKESAETYLVAKKN